VTAGRIRIAATGDLHCRANSAGTFQPLLSQAGAEADILLLCGDLADRGLPEEAQILAKEITSALNIPVVAVLGNHDYDAGREQEVREVLADAGVHVLDGETCEIRGVGFAGVKGFPGGFGARTLQSWGEPTIKLFVHEALDEALKLETALATLRTEHRIVLLHYAPVRGTVTGEPLEIFPFLGSSRLEEPLSRFAVTAVFHGHAHRGSPEARTAGDIPVYNVAIPLLNRAFPGRPAFRVIELPAPDGASPNGVHPELDSSYTVHADVDK
jgi:Icc-related predicted phosphoesterase